MASKKGKKFDPKKIIESSDWKGIQEVLKSCTEDEAKALLDYELANQKRSQWLNRFHQRFNKLRGQREKRELAVL